MNLLKGFKSLSTLILIFLLASCQDDDTNEPQVILAGKRDHSAVNNWIYEVMNGMYLWNDEIPIPTNYDVIPQDFFEGLLSEKDRFSFIHESAAELIGSLEGVRKEFGFEYQLFRRTRSSNYLEMMVLYVKDNSPASRAGLKRGETILKINDQFITIDNYQTLISNATSAKVYDSALKPRVVALSKEEVIESPSFMHKVITPSFGTRIGYYVYNFFSPGRGESREYDEEMDKVFADFKRNGVNELVLDLRYNSGGRVSSAINLASLIGPVTTDDVFAQYVYNEEFAKVIQESDEENGSSFVEKFLSKASNINEGLRFNRVYVITGRRTASASEAVINSLSPYMEVIRIGSTTVGKNVGSFVMSSQLNGSNYAIAPTVFKLENSLGESDYEDGFRPDYEIDETRFDYIELGDQEEPLLKVALNLIRGNNAIPTSSARVLSREYVGSSISERALIRDYAVGSE